jgi:hypothetical protein
MQFNSIQFNNQLGLDTIDLDSNSIGTNGMRVYFFPFHLILNEDFRVSQHGRTGHERGASQGDQVLIEHCINVMSCLAGNKYTLVECKFMQ